MDNFSIAENFSLLAKLIDIHGENAFKSKSYAIAAFNIEKLPTQLKIIPRNQLSSIKGINAIVLKKIEEILENGTLTELNELIAKTPVGIIEMLNIKGLGPKKINVIWKNLEIESIGELQYACLENRLMKLSGFGEKTQKNIQEAISFYQFNKEFFLFAEVELVFEQINSYLKKLFGIEKVQVTGAFQKQEPVIKELEFVVLAMNEIVKPKFKTAQPPELIEETKDSLLYKLKNGLKLRLFTGNVNLGRRLFFTSSSSQFVESFKKEYPHVDLTKCMYRNEEDIFLKAEIPFIPSYLRDSSTLFEKVKNNAAKEIITQSDIKGIIHSHSNWSDGASTIEEMAVALQKNKFQYLVISDHSKAAFYANGLSEERIAEQHKQIDVLNLKFSPFKIFKSIECDILNDGTLDYSNETLSSFDLVIASIHSNLKMTEEKAMNRLLNAIAHPHISILGHLTGRLLLSRNGYPIDHKIIINACAKYNVVIELNANPRRLDIDWQHVEYALDKGVLISINPDAHSIEGCNDIKYGILVAQKTGLTKEQNLSSFDLSQFENFISNQKKKLKN